MKMPVIKLLSCLLLALALAGCGGSGDEYVGFDASVKISTPNKYLTFFNRQGDLPAGDYTLVVATATANQTGNFSVSFTRNNGSATQLISGSWIDSGGLDSDRLCSTGNRCYAIDMQDATGAAFVLNTALDGVLYLVDDSDSAQVVETANANATGVAETLKYSASDIDESDFAAAYYSAVDPGNARDTAQKFLQLHMFNTPAPDEHVIFRDSKDLGYGRDMYMRSYANPSVCGGQMIVFLVRNFSVQIVDGFAYGPVNLEAAINQDLKHHFGSNAIEFGLGRADVGDSCSSEPMAKFYNYKADYSTLNAPHPRRLRVDLDARGAKAMPQPCISCHGGKLNPLDRFGRFVAMHANDSYAPGTYPPAPGDISDIGNTKARMQAFEVDTFEFSSEVGHRRSDYEDGLRRLNLAIYCTYPGSSGYPGCATHGGGIPARAADSGEWTGNFGREVLLGWYAAGGLDTSGTAFDSSFVPAGWTPMVGSTPVGADTLFTKVVGPNCFVCHGKRGTDKSSSGNTANDGKDLDFSSWAKFISHADEIEQLVFDEGRMPLGLLNYQDFWGDPEKGELLASFIAPFVKDPAGFESRRTDAAGNIILPGRVVARAGPDRVTQTSAAITLNAEASLFADGFSWSLLSSPATSTATISRPSSKRTDFSANMPGVYVLQLNASSSAGGSASDRLSVLVDGGLANAPRSLTFYGNILPTFAAECTFCHDNAAEPGVPVWWVADANQPLGIPATSADPPSLGLFEQVLARVNLEYVEDSLIVKKPSNNHHFGGLITGFDTTLGVGAPGRATYDRFVNWISEGAACGGTAQQCPR